jgi:hypothetical protein
MTGQIVYGHPPVKFYIPDIHILNYNNIFLNVPVFKLISITRKGIQLQGKVKLPTTGNSCLPKLKNLAFHCPPPPNKVRATMKNQNHHLQ